MSERRPEAGPTRDETSGAPPPARGEDVATDSRGRERPAPVSQPAPFSQQVGRIVLLTIAVLFVIFSLFNLQRVDFDWIFGSTEVVRRGGEYVSGGVPLIVLLLGAFVLGLIIGAGVVWRRQRVRHARWERDVRARGGAGDSARDGAR